MFHQFYKLFPQTWIEFCWFQDRYSFGGVFHSAFNVPIKKRQTTVPKMPCPDHTLLNVSCVTSLFKPASACTYDAAPRDHKHYSCMDAAYDASSMKQASLLKNSPVWPWLFPLVWNSAQIGPGRSVTVRRQREALFCIEKMLFHRRKLSRGMRREK